LYGDFAWGFWLGILVGDSVGDFDWIFKMGILNGEINGVLNGEL